jgi:diacylglycerol kinase family enzyme
MLALLNTRNGALTSYMAAMPHEHAAYRLRHVAVVMNAKAGALLSAQDDGAAALDHLFARNGMQVRFIGDDAGTLPERIEAALVANPDAVVVAGGDGTIACAAQVMHGKTETPLGILPFGTANLLARDLNLPIGDTEAAIAALGRGKVRLIDVAEVNGQLFLCAAMLGLPTHLGRHRENARGAKMTFLRRLPLAALRHILRPNPLRARLSLGGEYFRIRASAATITVNPVEEVTGPRFARQNLDGGRLVFYEIRARGIMGWAKFIGRVLARRWRRDPGLREWSGRWMRLDRLESRAIHVMVDGEMRLLDPPLDFTVHPGALRVLAG